MTLTRIHRAIIISVIVIVIIVFVVFLVQSQANHTSRPRFNGMINGSLFGSCETNLKKFKNTFTLLKDLNDRMKVYDAYLVCTALRDCFCNEMGCSEEYGHTVLQSDNDLMIQVGQLTSVCCDIIDQASQKLAMSKERWADWIKDSSEPDITDCDVTTLRFL